MKVVCDDNTVEKQVFESNDKVMNFEDSVRTFCYPWCIWFGHCLEFPRSFNFCLLWIYRVVLDPRVVLVETMKKGLL